MAAGFTEAMEERRAEVRKQEAALSEQLAHVRRELGAITLYLRAMRGELPLEDQRTSPPNQTKTRAERGEQRNKLLMLFAERPEGYTWAELKDVTAVAPGHEESRLYHGLQNMRRRNLVELTEEKRYTLVRDTSPAAVTHAAE